MQNIVVVSIYTPFCIITALILIIELLRDYKRQEDYLFVLLCFYALGWYVVNIRGLLASDEATAGFYLRFMVIFVGLIPPTLLLFIIKFYKITVKLPAQIIALMFVVPAVNILMVVTSDHHGLLCEQLNFISLSPYRLMEITWGPWFWVHTANSYILSLIIIAMIMYQHFRAAKFYRFPSTMMAVGVTITLVGNIVTLAQIIPPVIEPTLITMSLSVIFFYIAIINNNNSKFVRFSKSHIYHYLAEYILVLNEKNQIIDYNRAAGQWFSDQGIDLDSSSLEAVMAALLKKGKVLSEGASETEGVDVCIQDGMFDLILNQRTYQMKDDRHENIGKIVVFSDVTENRMLIQRLEMKAGMDSLTGLANHRAYQGAKKRFDAPEHLPLSVVVCDVNGLKGVNDTMGHEFGDLLIKTVADILEKVCPKGGLVARTGGDEFVYLLPNTLPEAALDLINRAREELTGKKDLPFTLSVAMGTATKSGDQEDLEKVIALADELMYADKKRLKAGKPPEA